MSCMYLSDFGISKAFDKDAILIFILLPRTCDPLLSLRVSRYFL